MSTTPSLMQMVLQQSDDFFRFSMASLIFVMQFGFGLFEAGVSRSSLTIKRTLLKSFLCTFASMVSFWLFGYALAFGGTNLFGGGQQYWAWNNLSTTNYAHFWLQFAYAVTSCSIATSALTERCHMVTYVIFTFIWSGFAYPIVAHWIWHPNGWLFVGLPAYNAAVNGVTPYVTFYDAAGSGVVHMTGGIAALVGSLFLGARIGRFDKFNGAAVPYRPHSSTLVMIGGAMMALGLVVFNGTGVEFVNYVANFYPLGNGASVELALLYQPFSSVALAFVNTVLAAASGAFTVYVLLLISRKPTSLQRVISGGLAGMASISCAAISVYTWAAVIYGFFAGVAYLLWSIAIVKLRADDVFDAFAIFCGGGGMWGLIATAFLLNFNGIIWQSNAQSGYFLAWQIVGILAIIAWTGGCSILIFGFLRITRLLRIREDTEMQENENYVSVQPKSEYEQPVYRAPGTPVAATSVYRPNEPPTNPINSALPRVAVDANSSYYLGYNNTVFR